MTLGFIAIPTKKELDDILKRRRILTKFHHKLYRKLKDIIGSLENRQDLNEIFCSWSDRVLGLDRFDGILYTYYMLCRIDGNADSYEPIKEYILRNHYVYWNPNTEEDMYDRFQNEAEAIKWIISYRATKLYFLHNLKESVDK